MQIFRSILAVGAMGACLLTTPAWAGALVAAPEMVADRSQYLTLEQLRAKYAQPGSKYMTIKGVQVHYMDEGTGPAILMVHGSSSTLKTYDVVAAKLKDRYRVIRYDIPPQGLSGPLPDDVAASMAAEDLPEILLTNLNVKDATVLGVSSGGTMAMYLAAKRPDLVARIILSNNPADVVDTAPMKLSKAMIVEQGIAGEASNGSFKRRSFWDAFFDFFTGEPERVGPGIREQYYDINRRLPEKNRFSVTALTANHAMTVEKTAKITCPVLLLWGERDPLLPPAAADAAAGYLKNASVSKIFMPDVGHYPPLEAPERFAQIVAAYIEAATPVKPIAKNPADR